MRDDLKSLTIFELDCFLQVAKLGSIREVARALNMQPAQLSRIIRRFEERSGESLFVRSHRGLSLTPVGIALRESVERSIACLPFLHSSELDGRSKNGMRLAGVGAAPYLCQFVLAPVLTRIWGEGLLEPTIIAELPADRLVLSGLRGHIDVAVHSGEAEWPSTWVSTEVGSVRWRLYGHRDYFPSPLSGADFKKLNVLYPAFWSPEGLRDGSHDLPGEVPVSKRALGFTSAVAALQALRAAAVASWLPDIVVRDDSASGVHALAIEGEMKAEFEDRLFLSFRGDVLTTKTSGLLAEALRAHVAWARS